MRDFTGCHFGYISEAVVVAASEAAGLITACLLQQLQGKRRNLEDFNDTFTQVVASKFKF